jgi:hypothetical protein
MKISKNTIVTASLLCLGLASAPAWAVESIETTASGGMQMFDLAVPKAPMAQGKKGQGVQVMKGLKGLKASTEKLRLAMEPPVKCGKAVVPGCDALPVPPPASLKLPKDVGGNLPLGAAGAAGLAGLGLMLLADSDADKQNPESKRNNPSGDPDVRRGWDQNHQRNEQGGNNGSTDTYKCTPPACSGGGNSGRFPRYAPPPPLRR